MHHQAAWQGSRCHTAAQPPALKQKRTALVPVAAAAPDDAAAVAAGAAQNRRPTQSEQPTSSDDAPPAALQQQQQQQPRIVLRPLSNPPASAAGSIVRSSQLGSWSAMGPPTPRPACVSATKQQQEQQQQRRHKGTAQRHAGEAGQHKHRQQQPRPAGKQQTHQRQQQQRRTKPAAQDSKTLASRARQMTTWLGRSDSISSLWDTLQECRGSPALNIVHVATAYKTCADLFAKQPRQQQAQQLAAQQQRQQLRPHGAEADVAVVPPEGPLDKTLLLLDELTALQLSVAAAAVSARLSGSSGSGSSSVTIRGDDWNARSLSSIVSSNARMRRKLPGHVLLLLLEAFLVVAGEAQPLLPVTTALPRGELQPQGQQQQQRRQHGSSGPGTSSTSVSGSSSSSGAAEPGSSPSPATSNGSSAAVSDAQSTCHALSLLVWGMSKLGFTATQQELSSTWHDSGQQQQQQQYWVLLAAVGARVAMAGSPRDVSTLCYGFASAGYKVGQSHWAAVFWSEAWTSSHGRSSIGHALRRALLLAHNRPAESVVYLLPGNTH